jgi:hypothetical protein
MIVVVAALLVAVAGVSWARSGAQLASVGNALAYGDLPVGRPVFVGYPLYVTGGRVEIDDVHVENGSHVMDSEFFVAAGDCPVGLALDVAPSSCDLGAAPGATASDAYPGMLLGRYVLTAETRTTADTTVGDIVVSYHDGLHRRTVNLGMQVCLSSTSRCRDSAGR